MMVEAVSLCKTLVDLNIMTWLETREDFTEFCQGLSFKTDK
jgi:alpha-D-ribose 1-methylphosphonate 5-triphosphate synthase subunit PhnH